MNILFILFFVHIVQRFCLTYKIKPTFDSWGHFLFIKLNKGRISPFNPIKLNIIESGKFYYPFLTHWLLSLIPFSNNINFLKYVNIVIECSLIFILTIILYFYSNF